VDKVASTHNVGIHSIIKHTHTHNSWKNLPIATNHNTTTLLEKKNWVLSFLMIYLLSLSSTPFAPSPKQLQPHKKKNKTTTKHIPKSLLLNHLYHPWNTSTNQIQLHWMIKNKLQVGLWCLNANMFFFFHIVNPKRYVTTPQ
jgi:hypothetical protein